jgi:hypothetical protein
MSAELLTQAIEGKDIDGLQDKLITIIKSACSKPIKAKVGLPRHSLCYSHIDKSSPTEFYFRLN